MTNKNSKFKGKQSSPAFAKLPVTRRYSFRAWRMKFVFRLIAVMDVIFAKRFELTTYRKDGSWIAKTNFDKAEIEDAGRNGLL